MKKNIVFIIILSVSLSACKMFDNQKKASKPNFLFILTDDEHRSDFNFLPEGIDENGKKMNLTPNIDKLASEGMIFDGIHCPSPLCVPSRFNYLTGMYASRATNDWFVDLHRLHGHTFIHQEPKITKETLDEWIKSLPLKTQIKVK